jgi:hypothetical protein
MKILFATEDSIYGILLAAIVLGLSGKYYNIPQLDILWGALFAIGIILTLFDIMHTFTDLSRHPIVLVGAFFNNLIDLILYVAFAAKMFVLNIPFLTQFMTSYITNPTYLFYIGAFLIITNVFWLVAWPFFD